MLSFLLSSIVSYITSGILSDFFAVLVASGVVWLVMLLFFGKVEKPND